LVEGSRPPRAEHDLDAGANTMAAFTGKGNYDVTAKYEETIERAEAK